MDESSIAERGKSVVSIVVPFWNSERYLEDAIESVLAQSYSRWELLLIDDGSTDASKQIARRYVNQYPTSLRYFEHDGGRNLGVCASRNLGVRRARGDYIAFLDSDDVWLPHKLERQVAILRAHPEAGMVYGRTLYWHSWTDYPEDSARDYAPALGVECDRVLPPPLLLTLSLESKAPTPCPSDILLRREVVEGVGGFEESFHGQLQLYEDQAFLAKVYLKTPVFVSGECWDKYRQHADSCVSVVTAAGRKHQTGLAYLKWLEQYLAEQGSDQLELRQALRTKRRRYRYPRLSPVLEHAKYRLAGLKNLLCRSRRRRLAGSGESGRNFPADSKPE